MNIRGININISIERPVEERSAQPEPSGGEYVDIFINGKVGLPLLLFLADVDFEYFRCLASTLWRFQFGDVETIRIVDSVVSICGRVGFIFCFFLKLFFQGASGERCGNDGQTLRGLCTKIFSNTGTSIQRSPRVFEWTAKARKRCEDVG